jgi:HK97 gp10 family phage protein
MLTSYSRYQPRENGRFIQAKVDEAVRAGIIEWAGMVLDTARDLVPVDTGDLKASGHVTVAESGKSIAAAVSFDMPYAGYVEYGTGLRGAASPGAGEYPYNSEWAGMPSQPYLRPAFEAHRSKAEEMTRAQIFVALD